MPFEEAHSSAGKAVLGEEGVGLGAQEGLAHGIEIKAL